MAHVLIVIVPYNDIIQLGHVVSVISVFMMIRIISNVLNVIIRVKHV